MSFRIAGLPACAPRSGNAFSRWLGRTVLRLGGWTMAGDFPDERKLVIIAAPHSSAWDAVWGSPRSSRWGSGSSSSASRSCFAGRWAGSCAGSARFRSTARAHGVVDQVAAQFAASDTMWFVLAPEGTRKRVEHWKTGFWHIARDAGVPVVCAYFHYPERTVGIGPLMHMTGNLKGDMVRVREYYRPWVGKNRGTT